MDVWGSAYGSELPECKGLGSVTPLTRTMAGTVVTQPVPGDPGGPSLWMQLPLPQEMPHAPLAWGFPCTENRPENEEGEAGYTLQVFPSLDYMFLKGQDWLTDRCR